MAVMGLPKPLQVVRLRYEQQKSPRSRLSEVERQTTAGTVDYHIATSLLFPGKAPLFRVEV